MLTHVVSGNDQPHSVPRTAHQTYTDNIKVSNGTSAQLGYTVPFMLENTGQKTNYKYR